MVRPTHSLVYRHQRLLLASPTGSEGRGKLRSKRPASCRRFVVSGDLASPARIPNWEREEGKATSRAPGLVPSLRRLQRPSSPTRIPNWGREEGKATSRAPGLVPSLRQNPLRMEKIAVSAWHLLQRPIPRPDWSFMLSWQKALPMQSSVCRWRCS